MSRILTLALGATVALLLANPGRACAQEQVLQVKVTINTMHCRTTTDQPRPVNDRDEIYLVVARTGPATPGTPGAVNTPLTVKRLPANDDYYEFKKGTRGETTDWTNKDQKKQGSPILFHGNLRNGEVAQLFVVVGEQDNQDLSKFLQTLVKIGKIAIPIISIAKKTADSKDKDTGKDTGKGKAGEIEKILGILEGIIKDNPDDVIGSFACSVMNDNGKLKVECVVDDKSTKKVGEGAFLCRGGGEYDLTINAASKLVAAGTPVPKRRVYLGDEVDKCSHAVLKVKGTSGMVEVRKGESKEVLIASPRITWYCGATEEKATLRPSTNLVVVQREKDGREITWKCYREE